ncbi:6746_t:CDS:1, partial [Entrophospora sp. SA101]
VTAVSELAILLFAAQWGVENKTKVVWLLLSDVATGKKISVLKLWLFRGRGNSTRFDHPAMLEVANNRKIGRFVSVHAIVGDYYF